MPDLLPQLRNAIRKATYADEPRAVEALLNASSLGSQGRESVHREAVALVQRCRGMSHKAGTLDAFLQQFGLSNNEGISLMFLS